MEETGIDEHSGLFHLVFVGAQSTVSAQFEHWLQDLTQVSS